MDKLGISLGFLISQIINFGLLMALLYLVLYKPMLRMLAQRRERVASSMADVDAARESAAKAQQEYDRQVAEAQRKAQEVITQAAQAGEQVGNDIKAEALQEAEAIRLKSREESAQEKAQLLADVQSQIATLSMTATERILGKAVDEKLQSELIDQFLAELGEATP